MKCSYGYSDPMLGMASRGYCLAELLLQYFNCLFDLGRSNFKYKWLFLILDAILLFLIKSICSWFLVPLFCSWFLQNWRVIFYLASKTTGFNLRSCCFDNPRIMISACCCKFTCISESNLHTNKIIEQRNHNNITPESETKTHFLWFTSTGLLVNPTMIFDAFPII